MQVVAGRDARLDLERALAVLAVLQDLDERDEEVRDALAQLLDVGVLVGRALVAVDGDALVHDVALEVLLLAERLHDELLEVAREEEQPVLVGEDDHVLRAAAARLARATRGRAARRGSSRRRGRASPRPSRPRRRASPGCRGPGARRGGGRRRRAPRSARRPSPTSGSARASRPVAATSSSSLCAPVTATAWPREGETRARVRGRRLEHAVARLLRAAGLRDHDRERRGQAASVAAMRESSRSMPSGSVLSKKNGRSGSRGEPSASATNCGPSAEPPMPTTRRFVKRGGLLRRDAARVHGRGEVLDPRERPADRLGRLRVGRELRRAQPVVADAPLLVGVRDRAVLERVHRGERGGERGRHERVLHAARRPRGRLREVDEERERGHVEREGLGAGPVVSGHGEPPLHDLRSDGGPT